MCSVWCPKKKRSSCAQPLEWPFELGFTEQIPKVVEDNSEHFRAFWETLFGSERAKKSPEIYFGPKSSRTIFETRTPVYSLAAPPLGLAKSIYYFISTTREWCRQSTLRGRLHRWAIVWCVTEEEHMQVVPCGKSYFKLDCIHSSPVAALNVSKL